jgi:hypothetical protein
MSNLYFPYNSQYGCELFSRERTTKLNNQSAGLPLYSQFYLHLINNTFRPVICNMHIDGKFINTYTIEQQSTNKVINYFGNNQFFTFNPNHEHHEHSEIQLEWIPVITKYETIESKTPIVNRVNEKSTPTMLSYDKRINYGCTKCDTDKMFKSDLNITFNKTAKSYTSGKIINQKIILKEVNPTHDIVNVRDYFVYNQPYADIPHNQLLDKLL